MSIHLAGEDLSSNGTATSKDIIDREKTLLHGKQCAANAVFLFSGQLGSCREEEPLQQR